MSRRKDIKLRIVVFYCEPRDTEDGKSESDNSNVARGKRSEEGNVKDRRVDVRGDS